MKISRTNKTEIFSDIKARLSILDVARHYGLEVDGGGFIYCPFQNEKTPSMKLYEKKNGDYDNFHCFGCGAHGNVIDLVSITFNLSPLEAANKLAGDFGITASAKLNKPSITNRIKQFNYTERESRAYRLLSAYCDYLKQCGNIYAPKTHDEKLHPLFIKCLNEESAYNYYKEIFIFGTKAERETFLKERGAVLTGIEKELKNGQTKSKERDISDDR